MSSSNCWFLTYIQVTQEAGKVVWYSYLSKNFPQFVVIHTIKGFSIVSEAEVVVFLEFSCFLCDPTDVGNLISGSSVFSRSNLFIWKFSGHILLRPILKVLKAWPRQRVQWMQLCSSFNILWDFPSLGLEWKLTFSSPVAIAKISKFAGILGAAVWQYHLLELK